VLRRVDFSGGDDVAILGGGTIGLFIAQWAKLFGARRVFVFDIHQEVLDRAKRYGADVTLNTLDGEFLEEVLEYTDGKKFGYVFEAAGVEATFRLAFQMLGTKTRVCCVGKPCPPKDFPFLRGIFENLKKKEFFLTGSTMSYSRPFPGEEWLLTLDYLRYGRLIVDDGLIYKKLSLTEIEKARELISPPRLAKGKIMMVSG
jgi:L-iditol 2-dehydrogenase